VGGSWIPRELVGLATSGMAVNVGGEVGRGRSSSLGLRVWLLAGSLEIEVSFYLTECQIFKCKF
jgi:hypothetical protein